MAWLRRHQPEVRYDEGFFVRPEKKSLQRELCLMRLLLGVPVELPKVEV